MKKDMLRQIFLSHQIKSASPDQAQHDETPAQTNPQKPADKSASPDQAHNDERPAHKHLPKPADKICIS
jgi:hypothetical protein